MSGISFIGSGGMARAIGARAVAGGNAVEIAGRDSAKARDLAAALGGGATAGTFGSAPAGATGLVTPDGSSGAQEIAQGVNLPG